MTSDESEEETGVSVQLEAGVFSFQWPVGSRKTAEPQRLAVNSPLPDPDCMGRGGGLWRVAGEGLVRLRL